MNADGESSVAKFSSFVKEAVCRPYSGTFLSDESVSKMTSLFNSVFFGARFFSGWALHDEPSVNNVIGIYRNGTQMVAGISADMFETYGQKPACKAGCNRCCSMTVEVSVPEGFSIVAYLVKNLSRQQMQGVLDKISAVLKKRTELGDDESHKQNVACALLDENGNCSVNPVKPIACSGYFSQDAEACDPNNEKKIPMAATPKVISFAVQTGIAAALSDSGVGDASVYELHDLLLSLMSSRGSVKKWLNREAVDAMTHCGPRGFDESIRLMAESADEMFPAYSEKQELNKMSLMHMDEIGRSMIALTAPIEPALPAQKK